VVALLAVAAGLFGLRFGLLHELSWARPLVDLRFDPFSAYEKKTAQARSQSGMPETGPQPLDFQVPGPDMEDPLLKNSLLALADPNTPGEGKGNLGGERKKGGESNEQASEDNGSEDGSEAGESAPSAKGGDSDRNPAEKDEQGKEPPPGTKDANSLLDKMRDALASLMEKMKVQGPKDDAKPAQAKGQGKKDGAQSASDRTQAPGKKQGKGEMSNDPRDAQAGQSEQAQAQQSSLSDQANENESPDSKSGAGRSDGRKDTELAEQLEAMGKISEILGKRAATVQGEMMVEVTSTRQQLRTPFLNRKATHGDSGGEIRRDEVPLHLQDYVQRYYDQVRKPARKQ
jgi:hypothetical protein